MKIRLAVPQDLEALVSIVSRNWDRETARSVIIELDQAFRPHDWRPVLYVAEWDGVVVGSAAFIASWMYYGIYELTWVNVHPDFRKRGIGKALVDRCISGIRPLGHLVMCSTHIPEYYVQHWGFKELYQHEKDQFIMSLPLPEMATAAVA